jgi:dihydroorotate dehydrogenase electron transfer subunit
MPVKPHHIHQLNKPYVTPIKRITQNSTIVRTFYLDYHPLPDPVPIKPGQFVMVWIQGIDEIPMSVSGIGPNFEIAISVAKVGDATQALHALKEGDMIGIRGPYGNWYEPKSGTAIVVGGGIGMASVLPLLRDLANEKQSGNTLQLDKIICIEGAKTEEDLLFTEEIASIFAEDTAVEFCTDDGSCGFKGFTTDRLDELLKQEIQLQQQTNQSTPITVYSCGPEIMLHKVFQICEHYQIEIQASLERMMRCGFGMCGLCALEPTGLLVCFDGPIFKKDDLRKTTDFGKYHREFSGKPIKL